jgi:triosephosphate isomerase
LRRPIIAGNWKLNKTIDQAVNFVLELQLLVNEVKGVEIVVAPAFTALSAVAKALKASSIGVSAQDLYWENSGAFTGEISPEMIVDSGCTYVIIGHSERRQFFGETNRSVNQKVKAALDVGLVPIICVGEMLEDREADNTEQVVTDQLINGINGLAASQISKSVIAYEPVWAIGTGKTASPDQAQEVHALIRFVLTTAYSAEVAESIRIQYGGSVKPSNANELLSKPDVDGALVGGASLEAGSFANIVEAGQQ